MLAVTDEPTTRWERLEDGYVLAAAMIIVTIIGYAVGGDHRIGKVAVVLVQSATLAVILRASGIARRTFVLSVVVMAAVSIGTGVSVVFDRQSVGPALVGAALALVGPVVIVRRVRIHLRIDVDTVAASVCIYLLAGLFFAYVFAVMDLVADPFFVQEPTRSPVNFVYFSFVTITTLGYGDLSPRVSLGKMLAVSEALIGQIYLVSVVALLVANIGRTRTPRGGTAVDDPQPDADGD
jgi:hypothetical protein